MRQNRARMASRRGSKRRAPKLEMGEPRLAGQTNAGSDEQKPKFEWVTVEHRDVDGNPTMPKELIASTYGRRYKEVPHGSEIKPHVLAGYKPKALMLVERKIYEIHRLSIRGWRRRGLIAVELEGWRLHEADWFNAMQGVRVKISDPALPGPHNEKSDYMVSKSSFGRKIVTLVGENDSKTKVHLFEGTLEITETWKSTWRRQGAEVLNKGFQLLLLPLFAALGAGLTLLWLDRSPSSDGRDLHTRENPAEHGVQTSNGQSGNEPPAKAINHQSPDVTARQTSSDKQESTNSPPKGDKAGESSSHSEDQ